MIPKVGEEWIYSHNRARRYTVFITEVSPTEDRVYYIYTGTWAFNTPDGAPAGAHETLKGFLAEFARD